MWRLKRAPGNSAKACICCKRVAKWANLCGALKRRLKIQKCARSSWFSLEENKRLTTPTERSAGAKNHKKNRPEKPLNNFSPSAFLLALTVLRKPFLLKWRSFLKGFDHANGMKRMSHTNTALLTFRREGHSAQKKNLAGSPSPNSPLRPVSKKKTDTPCGEKGGERGRQTQTSYKFELFFFGEEEGEEVEKEEGREWKTGHHFRGFSTIQQVRDRWDMYVNCRVSKVFWDDAWLEMCGCPWVHMSPRVCVTTQEDKRTKTV